MAQRRMFSKRITDTDLFTDMPLSTQCLYFHLNMNGDDDGFVDNTKRVQKMIGASEDDLKLLFAKEFLIPFESGVVVIKDWKIHNFIRKDRYQETIYVDEKKRLTTDTTGKYELGIPLVDQRLTQDRLGEDRLGKGREEEDSNFAEDRNDSLKKELEKTKKESSSSVFEFYESNGFGTLSPYIIQALDEWLTDITETGTDTEEAENIILKAMSFGVTANIRTWNYVNRILVNWEQRGLNTLGKIDAAEASRNASKSKSNNKVVRKETLPEWAEKDYVTPAQEETWSESDEEKFQRLARGE